MSAFHWLLISCVKLKEQTHAIHDPGNLDLFFFLLLLDLSLNPFCALKTGRGCLC